MKVVGLDLSLTSTGVAPSDGDPYIIKTTSKDSLTQRLTTIAERIALEDEDEVLFVIEEVPTHAAYAIGTLAKVHGAVLYCLGVEKQILYVSPPILKKYATGKGNAKKDAVLAEAIRRFDYQGTSTDEADAFILMHIGLELLGQSRVKVPNTYRDALKTLSLDG